MHINVKPISRNQVFETPEQAIMHIILHGLYPQKHWQDVAFGRDLADIRRVIAAIKDKDVRAFVAAKRRGYWRVELA